MSKTVKQMISRAYTAKLEGIGDAAVISIRGVASNQTNKLRGELRKKQVKVTVVRNNIARNTVKGSGLENLGRLLEGPTALAYGGASVVEVARELVRLVADFPGVELKGAVLDGTLFEGDKGVKELSKFPTKVEAQAQVVTLILSPAKNLMAQLKGPGGTVAGIVKSIETKLEKGETISRIAG